MNKQDCRGCLFGDMCPAEQACEYHSPLDEDWTEEYIEDGRQKFYEDWLLYVSEYND